MPRRLWLLACACQLAAAGFVGARAGGGAAHAARRSASRMAEGDVLLDVKSIKASITGKQILKGVNLQVKRGEVHAIMGPNGSGKSTLSKVIVGHPSYEVDSGEVTYRGSEDVLDLEPAERAQQGIFLAFQYPVEIPGVSNNDFLRMAVNKRRGALGLEEYDPIEFFGVLSEKMENVKSARPRHARMHIWRQRAAAARPAACHRCRYACAHSPTHARTHAPWNPPCTPRHRAQCRPTSWRAT